MDWWKMQFRLVGKDILIRQDLFKVGAYNKQVNTSSQEFLTDNKLTSLQRMLASYGDIRKTVIHHIWVTENDRYQNV